jgi:hypothetical protein
VRLWNTTTGVLQQIISVSGSVTYQKFDQDGLYLVTNLGFFDVKPGRENLSSSSDNARQEIFIEEEWVKVNRKNTLWLPPGSRPSWSAINGNLLALGHASGRISFVGFCT